MLQDQPSSATRMDVRVTMPDAGAEKSPEQSVRNPPNVYHYAPTAAAGAGGAARLVQALGWFSVGLGLAQLVAPRRVARGIGVDAHSNLVRALGVREVASGFGILTRRKPTSWLWSRVAGDAMDLALLGRAARKPSTARGRIGLVGAAVAGIAALDLLASMKAPEHQALGGTVEFEKTIVVNRPREECYRLWRDLEGFPRFMRHLESVRVLDDRRSYWKARGPMGFRVEWESELTADEPNEFMAWQSVAGSDVDNDGSVRFERAPGGRGTLVHVWIRYQPPGGAPAALAAKLFGAEPSQQIEEDLRRFKWLIETGEIPTTVGQPSGARGVWNRLVMRKGAAG